MSQIVFLDAFDRPFHVRVVDDEITAQSDQAPVELVFTPASARETAERLLKAADEADARRMAAQSTEAGLEPKQVSGFVGQPTPRAG